MHEQSIVESLLALSLENAQKARAARIVKINLVVGELSGVVEESLSFYFGFLSKGTIASEASLSFKHIPLQFRCRKCQAVFNNQQRNYRCPQCQGQQVDIIGGRELYLESLEVE